MSGRLEPVDGRRRGRSLAQVVTVEPDFEDQGDKVLFFGTTREGRRVAWHLPKPDARSMMAALASGHPVEVEMPLPPETSHD